MESRKDDRLQPQLVQAQEALAEALAEACSVNLARADTGELIRVEETLAIAGEAAKRAVSIRRKLGREHAGTGPTDAHPAPDAPAPTTADRLDLAPSQGRRDFLDTNGTRWTAYGVHPAGDTASRGRLPEPYRNGWLAFETDDEKRRLSPVPEGWQSLPDEHLAALCDRAEVVPRRPGARGG